MKLEKETARGGKWEFRGGKQVTINGAVNMRAIVSPVRIPPPPRSVVIYANLPVVNGVIRPGVQREMSHPSHGV